jgi:hypothetical protein
MLGKGYIILKIFLFFKVWSNLYFKEKEREERSWNLPRDKIVVMLYQAYE